MSAEVVSPFPRDERPRPHREDGRSVDSGPCASLSKCSGRLEEEAPSWDSLSLPARSLRRYTSQRDFPGVHLPSPIQPDDMAGCIAFKGDRDVERPEEEDWRLILVENQEGAIGTSDPQAFLLRLDGYPEAASKVVPSRVRR